MAGRRQILLIDAAAAVQGIVLVTFPAASTIFTDPEQYGLSSTQYGGLFLPQVVTAIGAALAGSWLGRRVGIKPVYLAGLACGLVAMVLLLVSSLVMDTEPLAYGLLLLATAFVGAGFGLTVPALNSMTAAFHPGRVDAAVLVLNALLGLGTVLAPVFVAVFVGLGFWWGLPALSAILLIVLVGASLRMPLRAGVRHAARSAGTRTGIPARFWVYAGFAVLYGACETVNGNWAQLTMTGDLGASATLAAVALTVFWAAVTLGRILFAAIRARFPSRWTYHLLPFVLAGAFVLVAMLPAGGAGWGVVAFGLAGFGCSALLPLTISFGQRELAAISASVTGGVIACYQLGYGIAAFGVGPLLASGVSLPAVYVVAAFVAVAMGALSFVVAGGRQLPDSLHPRPEPLG